MPDEIYAAARKQFSEEELIDLTLAIITVNCYNRINIAFRITAGTYQPGQRCTNKIKSNYSLIILISIWNQQ